MGAAIGRDIAARQDDSIFAWLQGDGRQCFKSAGAVGQSEFTKIDWFTAGIDQLNPVAFIIKTGTIRFRNSFADLERRISTRIAANYRIPRIFRRIFRLIIVWLIIRVV